MNSNNNNDKLIAHKIKLIKEFAEDNDFFSTDYIESVEEQFEKRGNLTENQEIAINNIIDKCKIKKWLKKKNHEEHKDLRMIFNTDERN